MDYRRVISLQQEEYDKGIRCTLIFFVWYEYLSLKLEAAARKKDITPINSIQPYVSHFLYADDVMLFATADVKGKKCTKH